jgi:hypothetical protein
MAKLITVFITASLMLAILVASAPEAFAQSSSDIMAQLAGSADEVEATRKSLVGKNMSLTATQAEAFWPVYENYRSAMRRSTDRAVRWITDYANAYNSGDIDTKTMRELLDSHFEYQRKVADVRSRFVSRFADVLPAAKVLRFYQVEHRLDLWVQSNLAEQIPLAE